MKKIKDEVSLAVGKDRIIYDKVENCPKNEEKCPGFEVAPADLRKKALQLLWAYLYHGKTDDQPLSVADLLRVLGLEDKATLQDEQVFSIGWCIRAEERENSKSKEKSGE